MDWFWAVVAMGLGAIFASYGGVVVERGWRGSNEGRSMCACGRQLRWYENIPVVSWVALRGRSRCCQVVIPGWYVQSEAGWAMAGVVLGAALGPAGAVAVVVAVLAWAGAVRVRRTR